MKIEPIQVQLSEVNPHEVIGRNVILIEQLTLKVKELILEIQRINDIISKGGSDANQ